jgi:hypothetical protein
LATDAFNPAGHREPLYKPGATPEQAAHLARASHSKSLERRRMASDALVFELLSQSAPDFAGPVRVADDLCRKGYTGRTVDIKSRYDDFN